MNDITRLKYEGLLPDNIEKLDSSDNNPFTILYDIWKDNPDKWTETLQSIENTYWTCCCESVRDSVREELHRNYPTIFPLGHAGTSVGQLAYYMLESEAYNATLQAVCFKYNYEDMEVDELHAYFCLSPTMKQTRHNHIPKTLVLEYPHTNIETSRQIKSVVNRKAIIYHGDNHFTSRIISRKGQIWYHDGMLTKETCIEDGTLQDMSSGELKECQGKDLILAVYSQV
ncbi:hypothetical protein BDZ94DRAFT_1371455 [Collybia nuda]|uniref:Uncharacterized protein n=1 Tax=Collybia nuda TaxID=64659 RepID=A0A9P5Y184_9AGAR|nr:hypothetical protein BDZ94DRAFT_1371455 [Collybia nuda]